MPCKCLGLGNCGPIRDHLIDIRCPEGMKIDFALCGLARNPSAAQVVGQHACHIMRHIEQGVDGRHHACFAGHVEALGFTAGTEVIETL